MSLQDTNPMESWPPPSLANINVEALVNDCEEAEVSGHSQQRPFATLVHLTALLYLGNFVEVGMLWKRTITLEEDALWHEWYRNVAMPMLEQDTTRTLKGLQHVSSCSPEPFDMYAQEIAQVVLQRNEDRQNSNSSTVKDTAMTTNSMVVSFLETAQWSI